MTNENQSRSGMSLGLAVLLSALGFGGYFIYKNVTTKTNAEDEAKKLATDNPTKQASLIKFYLGNWYQRPNVDALVLLARSITDWPGVVGAYSRLYAGDNLESDIKSSLQKWGGYEEFLLALSKKGLPATNTGNIVVKPKVTVTKKGDKLILDDSKFPVIFYKDWKEYPVRPLATVPVKKLDPKKKTVSFIQAIEAEYAGSQIKTTLYQISLSNGQIVWVNRERNIAKKVGKSGLGESQNLNIAY